MADNVLTAQEYAERVLGWGVRRIHIRGNAAYWCTHCHCFAEWPVQPDGHTSMCPYVVLAERIMRCADLEQELEIERARFADMTIEEVLVEAIKSASYDEARYLWENSEKIAALARQESE